MAKRMLDCLASDFAHFTKEDFLSLIAGSEGRVLTNAKVAYDMGVNMLIP